VTPKRWLLTALSFAAVLSVSIYFVLGWSRQEGTVGLLGALPPIAHLLAAAALAVEVAELQELFLWTRSADEDGQVLDRKHDEVADELADVLISALNLALAAGIDPAAAVWNKIERNEARYSIDTARGSAAKWLRIPTPVRRVG